MYPLGQPGKYFPEPDQKNLKIFLVPITNVYKSLACADAVRRLPRFQILVQILDFVHKGGGGKFFGKI